MKLTLLLAAALTLGAQAEQTAPTERAMPAVEALQAEGGAHTGPSVTASASPAAYDAASTFRKLVTGYPSITIASGDVAAPVQVQRNLVYARGLALDLYLPGPGAAAPPLVVLVHGGGWRSGQRANLAPLAARLAARGYAAATVNYRLSDEARYPAAIVDVKDALAWLRARASTDGFDPARIALAGASAGGQIASLAGMTAPEWVRAVINIDGLSDFTSPDALRHEDDPAKSPSAAGAWLGGRYADVPDTWRDASPINHVTKATPPVLFIVSSMPRFSAGREAMSARLAQHGILVRTVALPGTPHSFWLFDPWLAPAVDAMTDFLGQVFGPMPARAAWSPDLGDGRYRNPILHADYADPDVIRVGTRYYMVSSSFASAPGLPLLVSDDMVNWNLIGHALPELLPRERFRTPRHGEGVWAPCLRYHDGKFWIFYPDPDQGIFVTTAADFAGPWSTPHLLLAGQGIIDPTPLWDDDGQAWLMHGWAKSRAGFNNVLTLRRMSPDARGVLDGEGRIVIDGNALPGYRTLEGPKLYKANGWYYVFAPAGGVEQGWQSVFRSRRIEGPYEARIVMEQGSSAVNGPHQGAWVTTPNGADWFFHFQDKRAYGRVVHLQPMHWADGWPLIGEPSSRPGVGQPVSEHVKPVAGTFARREPQASDEFDGPELGPQWQWAGNWNARWYELGRGRLRLFAQPERPVREMASVLTQKFPAPVFRVTAKVALDRRKDGDQAGLGTMGLDSTWIGVRATADGPRIVLVQCRPSCTATAGPVLRQPAALLRMQVTDGARAAFSFSEDGERFQSVGQPVNAVMGRWVGAQIGVFATGAQGAYADIDYVRVTP